MKIIIYRNNKPDSGESFDLPYTVITDSFLDEELDTCAVEIKHTRNETPFPRFCIAALYPTENAEPKYFFVASDVVLTDVASGLSDHELRLVEPTKWLERFMVGNKCVTQPLYTDYLEKPITITEPVQIKNGYSGYLLAPLVSGVNKDGNNYAEYTTPIRPTDTVPIFNPRAFNITGAPKEWECTIKIGSHTKTVKNYDSSNGVDTTYGYVEFEAKSSGTLTVTYLIKTSSSGNSVQIDRVYHAKYEIAVIKPEDIPQPITLKDAAFSMICAAETLRYEDGYFAPRFVLNDASAAELEQIVSPELTVTNATLREALDEIGKVVDSITRLDIIARGDRFDFEITFEKYCKTAVANVSELGDPCLITRKASCEDYCTALDATVENLVQYDDGGSILDPSANLWRTVRSEDSSYRVTEKNAIIQTAFPIERIDSLTCRIYSGEGYEEIELKQYLFEASEYSALSSYSTAYPYSKAYALCYTLGQKNITGLNFTTEHPVHEIFKTPALVNIVNKELGKDLKTLDFTTLLFRVGYVPTGSSRIIMRKPNSYGGPESVLTYNQSAAKIDSKAFGRSMFGAVLRMGNTETAYTYIAAKDAHVPEKGERFGENGYIAEVREEYAPEHKKVVLTVVDGFNRISQFVGVNKAQRIFEISERMSLERHIVYEDKCLVSTVPMTSGAISVITRVFRSCLTGGFRGFALEVPLALHSMVRGYDKKGNALSPCILPCAAYAVGNALSFSVGFENNYSAGRRIDAHDNAEFYDTETDVCYTDLFGRVNILDFEIRNDTTFAASEIDVAKTLPERHPNQYSVGCLAGAVGYNRLYVDKDARETIKTLSYQVSFLGDDDIKVSPYLTQNFLNALKKKPLTFRLIVLGGDDFVDETTEWIDIDGRTVYSPSDINECGNGRGFYVKYLTGITVYGWAIVSMTDTVDGTQEDTRKRILLSQKKFYENYQSINVYFNFYH